MQTSKTLILSLLIALVSCGDAIAQDIKPMAPAMDITSKAIEKSNEAAIKYEQSIDAITTDNSILPANNTTINEQAIKEDTDTGNDNSTTSAKDKAAQIAKDINKADKKEVFIDENILKPPTKEISEFEKSLSDFEKDLNNLEKDLNKINNQQPDPVTASIDKEIETTVKEEEIEDNSQDNPLVKAIDAGEEELIESAPVLDPETKQKISVHNTSIKKEAESVEFELRLEEPKVLKDLRVLWSAAVEKSTTIRLAIQKLSNPDESENVKQGTMSKLLSPIANLAPLAMMASSSSTQAAGAMLGGGMLGTLASDTDNDYNRALLKISDYDLIMLAKEVDELQAKLVVKYYEYRHSIERYEAAEGALKNAYVLYEKAQGSDNFAANTAADAFYREAVQNNLKAKQHFLSARTALEQITGNDAIVYIETHIDKEDKEKQGIPEGTNNVANTDKPEDKK